MTDLSIIIVSYNTKSFTRQCLQSLKQSLLKSSLKTEIIVVDNNSTDGSYELLRDFQSSTFNFQLIHNKTNLGFGTANNIGIEKAHGKYVLLLNSDAFVEDVDFDNLVSYMEKYTDVGALTVRLNLSNGNIDPASHRGFPTIWRSFCFFSGLEKICANIPLLSRIFGGYHLTHLSLSREHEVDAVSGAFLFTRRSLLGELGGFDENFFMYGEDLDLCYLIKKKGHRIIYYPSYTVIHHKHQSGLKHSKKEISADTRRHFYQAMKIFYEKHYAPYHLKIVNKLAYLAIDIVERLRS